MIDPDGNQIGILSVPDAILKANEFGMDLVEISPTANPPVCKIVDFGKYKYLLSKKSKEAKKKQHVFTLKEIQLRPHTDNHDYDFKIKHAREFLSHHHKVKILVRFRGRELVYKDNGEELIGKAVEDLSDIAIIETPIKFEGKNLIVILSPRPRSGKHAKNEDKQEYEEKIEEDS